MKIGRAMVASASLTPSGFSGFILWRCFYLEKRCDEEGKAESGTPITSQGPWFR